MKILDNCSVLVLGVDAIGAGIARRFAREGARVVLLDDDIEAAEGVAREIVSSGGGARARPINWGPGVASAVAAGARAMGGLDILVNNVLPRPGIASLEAQTDAMFEEAFQRVRAAVGAMQGAFDFLKASGRGRVIGIGHRYGQSVNANIAAYSAAAHSLAGIIRTAAADWGQYQIASNLLLPLADTPEFRACHARRPKVLDLMVSQLALARAGDPEEDIGGAALYLASDCASYINGETVYADGGQHIAGAVLDIGRFAGTGGKLSTA